MGTAEVKGLEHGLAGIEPLIEISTVP